MSREDPKPGRWLLPLVVAGLVGFTFVFVNALPEAEVEGPDTANTTTSTSTTRPPTTTTPPNTLNPDAAAFIETTNSIERNVADLSELAQQVNDAWDARDEEYTPTREALEDVEAQTLTLADDVAALAVPVPAESDWDEVTAGLALMRTAAADMIDGLVNAETGEPRLAALEIYKTAASSVTEALADVRASVRDPAA